MSLKIPQKIAEIVEISVESLDSINPASEKADGDEPIHHEDSTTKVSTKLTTHHSYSIDSSVSLLSPNPGSKLRMVVKKIKPGAKKASKMTSFGDVVMRRIGLEGDLKARIEARRLKVLKKKILKKHKKATKNYKDKWKSIVDDFTKFGVITPLQQKNQKDQKRGKDESVKKTFELRSSHKKYGRKRLPKRANSAMNKKTIKRKEQNFLDKKKPLKKNALILSTYYPIKSRKMQIRHQIEKSGTQIDKDQKRVALKPTSSVKGIAKAFRVSSKLNPDLGSSNHQKFKPKTLTIKRRRKARGQSSVPTTKKTMDSTPNIATNATNADPELKLIGRNKVEKSLPKKEKMKIRRRIRSSRQEEINSKEAPKLDDKTKKKDDESDSRKASLPVKTQFLGSWRRPGLEKTFAIRGRYSSLSKALLRRGWKKSLRPYSYTFDLKYEWPRHKVDYAQLRPNQIFNRAEDYSCLTDKSLANKYLKNSKFFCDYDSSFFKPLAFDSSDEVEMEEFRLQYRLIQAESILKRFLNKSVFVNIFSLFLAIRLVEFKLRGRDGCVNDHNGGEKSMELSEFEVELLDQYRLPEEAILAFLRGKCATDDQLEKIVAESCQDFRKRVLGQESLDFENSDEILKKINVLNEQGSRAKYNESIKLKISQILHNLHLNFPQTKINGDQNIWIIKPSHGIQGIGIQLATSISSIESIINSSKLNTEKLELLQQIQQNHQKEAETNPKEPSREISEPQATTQSPTKAPIIERKPKRFTIQKYIENPLLYNSYKFDLRQWVLVTSFNPLTVWIYDEFYGRVSMSAYTNQSISNKFSHLTNVSLNKKAEDYCPVHCHLYQSDLKNYIEQKFGKSVFEEKIVSGIKRVVSVVMQSFQPHMVKQSRVFQILGFDFLVDEELNVWFLEANKNPDLQRDCELKKRLVVEVFEDYAKVVVDLEEAKKRQRKGDGGGSGVVGADFLEGFETGKWRWLDVGRQSAVNFGVFDRRVLGLDLEVNGSCLHNLDAFKAQCEVEDEEFRKSRMKDAK